MGFPIYKCGNEFPNRIQDVLRDRGFEVEALPEIAEHMNRIHGGFSFRVRRGNAGIRVAGAEEKGAMHFHVVFDNSLDPISWRPSEILADEVQAILVEHGAELVDLEELD
jgi:hypothetical protein